MQEYNGWFNIQTWAVNRHIDQNEPISNWLMSEVRVAPLDNAVGYVVSRLHQRYDELIVGGRGMITGAPSLNWKEVNWIEIAESWLDRIGIN